LFNKKKEPTNHVSIPDLNMAAKVEDRPMMAMNLRNRLDELQEENRKLREKIDKLEEEELKTFNSFRPLVLAHGKQVFESLQKAKPRTILVPLSIPVPDTAQVLKPVPKGQLIKAYVVENLLALKCLYVSISSKDGEMNLPKNPNVVLNVVLNGIPVVCDTKGKVDI